MPSRRKRLDNLEGAGAAFSLRSVEEEIHAAILVWVRGLTRVVLEELWSEEVDRVCGPRWSPRKTRAVRGGSCKCEILLCCEWVEMRRPRVRTKTGRERALLGVLRAEQGDLLAPDWKVVKGGLDAISRELENEYPTTAALIRVLIEDTLTLQRIGRVADTPVAQAAPRGGAHPLVVDHT